MRGASDYRDLKLGTYGLADEQDTNTIDLAMRGDLFSCTSHLATARWSVTAKSESGRQRRIEAVTAAAHGNEMTW